MKKVSTIAFTVVFLLLIGMFGAMSFAELVHYYDTGTVKNNEWNADRGSKLEADIATNFYEKDMFVDMNGAMRRVLGQREMNGVVKLDNGYLLTAFKYEQDEKLHHNADRIIQLKNYLDEQGIELLYVITPYASGKYDPQIPEGVSDYGNDNLDRFAGMLEEGGVEPLDLRDTMLEDGVDHYDMMYKTDHHWTTEAGFYAYTKINDILMQKLDCDVDPRVMDFSNYTITTYPRWHLGSSGQRTGAYFAGIDDFDLILPSFDTSISDGDDVGTFEDIAIRKDALEKRDTTSRYTYDSVLFKVLGNYTNDQAMNDKRILLMTDSFGRAVTPFLMLSYREVRTGRADHATIDEYKPDAIVILQYIENVLQDDSYDDCAGTE